MQGVRLCLIAVALLGLSTQAPAESWPAHAIHIIVPYSPGSASDIIPRTVLSLAEKKLGQPILVENRPGGGSTIGTAFVARANPDGYTFLSTASAFTTVPVTVANLSYDPQRDFTAVIPLANMTNVLVISPDSGIKTLAEFVAYARAQHGSINYVTIGMGSAAHLNSERFRLAARFEAQPIPYKGSPEGLTDVMTGRVHFYFSPLLPALPLIQAGKLLALAVSSSQRDPRLPDVPTTTEAGYPNSEYNFWFGMFAPAKTPPAIVQRFYEAIAAALQDADVRDKLTKLGVQPMPMTPSQFDVYIAKELEQNAELVKAGGLKPE
jgi:tripartite-type tricarboxylate transporter receptor subunit TctC